jgi:hypothetical protein
VSDREAHAIAPDMRTTPGFVLDQRLGQRATQLGCYVRNVAGTAISLSVPLGVMERELQMPPETYRRLLDGNRARVSGCLAGPVPDLPSP